MEQPNQSVQNQSTLLYVPNSSEKKRAILMYIFFGIMIGITKKEMTPYEYFHIKQASGRRIIFLLVLILTIVILFLPLIKYLVFIPALILFIAWVIFVKQARDGKYTIGTKESPISIFAAIGGRLLTLFEIEVKIPRISDMVEVPLPSSTPEKPTI